MMDSLCIIAVAVLYIEGVLLHVGVTRMITHIAPDAGDNLPGARLAHLLLAALWPIVLPLYLKWAIEAN